MMNWIRVAVLLVCVCCAPSAQAERRIDLVLALDTTGSMAGLIERAKAELWRIVDQLAASDSDARIRLGLVAYRDRGDAYVTEVHALSSNIDESYGRLLEFEAGGGGDTPESVNQALADAVDRVGWDSCPNVQRAIILAGDAPPHMDYRDEVQWPTSVRNARERGIAIHTIACGGNPKTQQIWRQIAEAADGRYALLSQTPARAIESPWDGQLAALNRALSETVVPYGTDAERERLQTAMGRTEHVDSSAAAARASYLGRLGAAGTAPESDLVAIAGGEEFGPGDIALESLPPEFRSQTREQLLRNLQDQLERRTGLLTEVAYYAEKRDAFLGDHRRSGAGRVFSQDVVDALVDGAKRSTDPNQSHPSCR